VKGESTIFYELMDWLRMNFQGYLLFAFLDRRAFNTSVRTVHTTIPLFGFQLIMAARTLPKVSTIIHGHLFRFLVFAMRTGNRGL